MRWLVLIVVLVVGTGYAQQPGQHKKNATTSEQRETGKGLFAVRSPPSSATETEPIEAEQEQHAQQKAEERKLAIDTDLAQFTRDVAAYTDRLFWVGAIQAVVLLLTGILIWRQLTAARTTERAYVKMSHVRPGIRWFEGNGQFLVTLEVKNSGNTPADVTDVVIRPILVDDGQLLPKKPQYGQVRSEESFHAFLVKDDYLFYNNPELLSVGGAEVRQQVADGAKKLVVFGYVDYIDKFGQRHRSGYARVFNPRATVMGKWETVEEFAKRENNLAFLSQRGYNYDRKRRRGEGNDWDSGFMSLTGIRRLARV